MKNIVNVALVGYGVVGQGVVKILQKRRNFIKFKYGVDFNLKTICDRSIAQKNTEGLTNIHLTSNVHEAASDPNIDIIIELMGGMNPAKQLVTNALNNGKHVITANKELIANSGSELFQLARSKGCYLYFESSVGAGIPVIKTLSEGVVGNKFKAIYGIINGTCNFILDEMTKKDCSFEQALAEAQKLGYAESNPSLDVNGTDSTHKLAILTYLAFGKWIPVKDIYTEGISQISHDDIEHAERIGLTIKLLAIAKRDGDELEVRVHPTFVPKAHPLASINSVYNAVYLDCEPLGHIMLSGQGAGQMSAASGVIADLINCGCRSAGQPLFANNVTENTQMKLRPIDDIETKFYIRIKALDKPGVLGQITGILGQEEIGINSVTQTAHDKMSSVPVIMLTDYTTEKRVRFALNQIQNLPTVKGKPVAIRMEKLW